MEDVDLVNWLYSYETSSWSENLVYWKRNKDNNRYKNKLEWVYESERITYRIYKNQCTSCVWEWHGNVEDNNEMYKIYTVVWGQEK